MLDVTDVADLGPVTHPLIDALIAELPRPRTAWGAPQRKAWLAMMAQAFDVVYGTDGSAVAKSAPLAAIVEARPPGARKAKPRSARPVADDVSRPTRPGVPPGAEFIIDREGTARRVVDDQPIDPQQVTGVIYDLRGELGDLRSIRWASGSVGIPKGLHLDISATF